MKNASYSTKEQQCKGAMQYRVNQIFLWERMFHMLEEGWKLFVCVISFEWFFYVDLANSTPCVPFLMCFIWFMNVMFNFVCDFLLSESWFPLSVWFVLWIDSVNIWIMSGEYMWFIDFNFRGLCETLIGEYIYIIYKF